MKAFECRMCGECCYGEGGIFLQGAEAGKIAGFLEMSAAGFLARFCEKRHGRFYLKSGPDGYCCFYDQAAGCRIHPVKPTRCAQWPFFNAIVGDRDNWKQAQEACPGINPDCSFEEFVKQKT
jgi:Fe-S-cluster containining protein